jgi:hypothetical protein
MARCAHEPCRRWRPGLLVRSAGLGLHLDDAWYCSPQCLGIAVRNRLAHASPIVPPVVAAPRPLRLGGVLAIQKRLEPAAVEQAASAQARTGHRIGRQLVELGLVTRLDVLRALAAQNGIGFLAALDPGRLTHAPGNLSPAVVRALRVVPFEADARHDVLKVACTAPVPRASLAALRELTGSIIEPYLVADDQWPEVLRAYGTARPGDGSAPVAVTNLEALADRVAATARQAGAIRMSEARCEDHLWVRLDAGGRIEELVLPSSQSAAAAAPSHAPRAKRPRTTRPASPAARRQRPRPVTTRVPVGVLAAIPVAGSTARPDAASPRDGRSEDWGLAEVFALER